MKKVTVLICVFAYIALVSGVDEPNIKVMTLAPAPTVSLTEPPKPTTTPTEPPKPTTAPTEPPKPTTTPTEPPKPTTAPTEPPKPTTTPTEPPIPTTTPTDPPKTTTLAPTPPTTSSAPPTSTPSPVPSTGSWYVTENNKTCISAKFAVQLNISYILNNKTTSYVLDIPADNKTVSVTGQCGNITQSINLKWGDVPLEFILDFGKNDSSKKFEVDNVTLKMNSNILPGVVNGTNVVVQNTSDLFTTSLDMSYKCNKQQMFNLTIPNDNTTYVTVTVSDLQLQAFKTGSSTAFSDAEDCESSGTPDIVPIVVGSALAALVAFVLIAYLIGRRRSQPRGYYSIGEDQSD